MSGKKIEIVTLSNMEVCDDAIGITETYVVTLNPSRNQRIKNVNMIDFRSSYRGFLIVNFALSNSTSEYKERSLQIYRKHMAQMTCSLYPASPRSLNVEDYYFHYILQPEYSKHRGVRRWADATADATITVPQVMFSPPSLQNQEDPPRAERDASPDERLQPVTEDSDLPTLGRDSRLPEASTAASSSAVEQQTIVNLQANVKADFRFRRNPPTSQLPTSNGIDITQEQLFVRGSSSSKQPLKPDARAAIAGVPRNIKCWAIQHKDPESQHGVQPVQEEQVIPGTLVCCITILKVF